VKTVDPGGLWQPGVDAPLFPGELLAGPEAVTDLDPALREQIGTYLLAVAAARGFPVHVAAAWNALHYGYDLVHAGYSESLLNADAFPTLDPKGLHTTPTGAMVLLPGGTPVWAEVMHVELDDEAFDTDGDLPAVRSGAPADTRTRLRAVVDPVAFGPLLPEQHAALTRLTRKGTLDATGHVTGPVTDTTATAATVLAADPVRAYANWLAAEAARLGGGPVPAVLGSTDRHMVADAVYASLQALLVLLAQTPGAQLVGEHLCPPALSVLPAGDVDDITRRVTRVRRRQVRHTGAGVAVRQLHPRVHLNGTRYLTGLVQVTETLRDRAMTGGTSVEDVRLRLDDAGRGGGVWCAVGAGQPDPGAGNHPLIPLGLGARTIVVPAKPSGDEPTPPAPVDEPAANTSPATSSETSTDASPDSALDSSREPNRERGKQRTEPGIAGRGTVDDEPEDEPDSDTGNGLLGDLDVSASHLTYTVALRVRHLAHGTLPAPAELAEHLHAAARPLAVRLGHPDGDLADDETFHEPVTHHDEPHQVRGITWPLAFHPGLLVTTTWTVGGRILDVTSELLPDPVTFAGVTLTHATDLAILAAHLGLAASDAPTANAAAGEQVDRDRTANPGTGLDGDPSDDPGCFDADDPLDQRCGTGGPTSDDTYGELDLSSAGNRAYLALLIRTLLRTVTSDSDGTRTFTAGKLVATTFAGLPVPADAVGRAHRLLDAYAHRGRLLRLPGTRRFVGVTSGFVEDPPTYVWWPPGQAAPLRRLPTPSLGRLHRPHWVPVSLRQLPHGWSPSPEKVASWPAVRANLGDAYLPWNLPPGHTWVEAHERGSDPGWKSGAVRDA